MGLFNSKPENSQVGATAPRVNASAPNAELPVPRNNRNNRNTRNNVNVTNVVTAEPPPKAPNTPVNVNKAEREQETEKQMELEEGDIDIVEKKNNTTPPVKVNMPNNQTGGKRRRHSIKRRKNKTRKSKSRTKRHN